MTAQSPAYAFPYGSTHPFAFAAIQTLGLYAQAARALTLPFTLDQNVRNAIQQERGGKTLFPKNTVASFGITTARVKGQTVPVDVSLEHVSATCDLWHFRCAEHKTKPTMVLVAPYSGSRSTIMKHLAAGFLADRNVVVIGWVDPHHVKKEVSFTLEDNTDDVISACAFLSKQGILDYDLMGVSQSGIPVAVATNLVGACRPANIIIAGAPINTRIDRTHMNWMAEYNALPPHIFITVGDAYKGRGRAIIPYGVMQALYRCTPNSLTGVYEHQGLAAENTRHMHKEIFQNNALAQKEFYYRGHKIDLSRFGGGLMTCTAENDAICSPRQTEDAHRLFTGASRRKTLRLDHSPDLRDCDLGHYSLVKPGAPLNKMVEAVLAFTQREASVH